jgi:hypothetical protein
VGTDFCGAGAARTRRCRRLLRRLSPCRCWTAKLARTSRRRGAWSGARCRIRARCSTWPWAAIPRARCSAPRSPSKAAPPAARPAPTRSIPADTAAGSGASYVGVVARIPLYSALEIDRERERELRRRKAAAEAVGALTQALAEWGVASRKLALFRALEKRAQERVAVGVAETGEQVQYLKEVADLEGRLNESRAKVVEARMTFIGLCAEGAPAERVDAYIRRFTRGIE